MRACAARRAGVLAVAAAVVLGLVGCGGSGHDTRPSQPGPDVGQAVDAAPPAAVLSAPLSDESGNPQTLSGFRGKLLVLSDAMTLCQETCPIDTAALVEVARQVDKSGFGGDVEFVSLTVDPNRDTPQRLRAYRAMFDPVPANWTLLTGSPTVVHGIWKALGVYWKKVPEESPPARDWLTGKPLTYDIDHSDELFFFDTARHERFLLEGSPHVSDTAAVPPELMKFMDADGHRNLTHPEQGAWTPQQAVSVLSWLVGRTIG